MAKHKAHRTREPNGRLSRAADEKEYAQALIATVREFGAPMWRTELGRLYLNKKITAHQFNAGQKWETMRKKYLAAINASSPDPKAINLEIGLHSQTPDPDSELGQRLAETESGVVKRWKKARTALLAAGKDAHDAVRTVCESKQNVGWYKHQPLVLGLETLARHWHLTQESRHGR